MASTATPALRVALRRAAAPVGRSILAPGASALARCGRQHGSRSPNLLAALAIPQQRRGFLSGSSRAAAPAEAKESEVPSYVHFRASQIPHPLRAKPHQQVSTSASTLESNEKPIVNIMQNHIWSKQEIDARLDNLYQHRPETFSDRCMHGLMYTLYKAFNWVTGFKPQNTPVKAVEWRLIVLESVAGVPGFMAAMFRHFRSLRTLKRDHGWIHTLLEEAENERMHLLVCMRMFKASPLTRVLVLAAQVVMTPFLASLYIVHPRSVHRFVGYLEETACVTYANIIKQVETPGTPLNEAWSTLPAPALGKAYWKLPEEAMWVDCLKCMFADEANHRDVNHTFAMMQTDDPNPFVEKHANDAAFAWRLDTEGRTTDVGCSDTLGTKKGSDSAGAASVGGALGTAAA